MRRFALTRSVSGSFGRCELTHLERTAIDLERARQQHAAYEVCLAELGCEIRRLPEEPDLPDAVFIEDTAVILDEIAIATRPGVPIRRDEVASVARALAFVRPVAAIPAPATLDGGDVLRVGRKIFVGRSDRTNREGFAALKAVASPLGYEVREAPVRGCLHLKSAMTAVAVGVLLINPEWTDPTRFAGFEFIEIDPSEPFAANALLVGESVLYPAAFPRTAERLAKRGIPIRTVDVSELAKAEGAVTCCSLILEFPHPARPSDPANRVV